jgi:hypothetical protein
MGVGRDMVRRILQDALQGDTEEIGRVRSEIEQGLGQRAVEYGTKGLGHIGDVLDIPGAFVRGVVGAGISAFRGEFGQAGERLLSALPGSEEVPQMLGLGQGFRAPTGQDLLTDIGFEPSNTMEEERRVRIAMAAGLGRGDAAKRFTTRYEEEQLSAEQSADFQNVMQRALQIDPDLQTGITSDDIKRATSADDFMGFAAEIALDPLTYLTMGASAAGKAAKLVQAASRAARFTKFADEGIEVARLAERAVLDSFKGAETLEDAVKVVGALELPDAGKRALLDALPDAYKGGKPDLELGKTLMDQVRAGQYRVGFQLPFGIGDPVLEDGATKAVEFLGNSLAAVGKGAMKVKPVANFVAAHPGMKYAPKKLWLRLAGEGRKADALGNPQLEEILLHEQHFNREANYEALKFAGELKSRFARVLNDATAVEREEVLRRAPGWAENPLAISFARNGLLDVEASSDKVRGMLLDYAETLRASDDELFALQNKWGLGVAELAEDFSHVGRQFSDELLDLFSKRPDARAAWLGAKTKLEKTGMQNALLNAEKGRVLRGMGFDESETFMREQLKGIIPDDMPVWNPNPEELLQRRLKSSAEAAKLRNLSHVAAEVYGYTPPGAVDVGRRVVQEAVDVTGDDAARRAAIAQELLFEAEGVQAGFREGRAGVRQAATIADRNASRVVPAAERAADIGQEAGEVGFAAKAGAEMRRGFPVEAENVLRTFADEAKERVRALAGDAPSKSPLTNSMQRQVDTAANKYVAEVQRAQDAWFDANPTAIWPRDAKKYAKETYGSYAKAVREFQSDLKKAAPAAASRELDKMAGDLLKQVSKLQAAEGAVGKPVAKLVNKATKEAERKAALADEMFQNSDVSTWSREAKAEYVLRALKQAGLSPNPGETTALEVMMKSRVQLPDSLEDIADLGTKFLNAADGEEFGKYAANHYWKHLDTPSKFAQVYDAIKGIYQRTTLARVSSLARDLVGTTSQSLMAGNHKYLAGATKALGGSLENWRNGVNLSEDVLRLQAAGALATTKGDAAERVGTFGGLLGKVEESGVVGGTLRSVGADKLGRGVGKVTDLALEGRMWWEQVNRVATYRKALAEGMSEQDAIAEVMKYWGNFSELSKLERKYVNRIMFFWSWMARSVPTALRTMIAHPVKARLALSLVAGNVAGSESQPEWMRRMGGWMLGQDENGNYTTINLGNSTYFSPLMSGLQSDFVKEATRGNLARAFGEAGRELAASAPPFVGGIYERITEKEAFTNEGWWADPKNRVGTRQKAPAGFYWLENTALGNWLGVKSTSEETAGGPKIKQVYMSPEKANILSFIPGFEPFMQDVSSIADPRKQVGGGFSPLKGASRAFGVPIYDVPVDDERIRDARRFKMLLAQSVDEMPGSGLTSSYGSVTPNKQTERGRQIQSAIENLQKQAQNVGLDGPAEKAFVYERLATVYPDEARWLSLNARIQLFEKLAEKPKPVLKFN